MGRNLKVLDKEEGLDDTIKVSISKNNGTKRESLFHSNGIYKLIFESCTDLMTITRLSDGIIMDINRNLYSLLEYSPDEIIGKTANEFKELNIYVDYSQREELFNMLLQENRVDNHEVLLKSKSGKHKTCLFFTQKIEKDNDIYILTIIRDITIQKNAEDVLKKHKEELNKIVEERTEELQLANNIVEEHKRKFEILSNVSFEGILIHKKGVLIDMNNAFKDMFGYTKNELANKDLVKLLTKKEFQKKTYENIKYERVHCIEVVGIKKDGTEFPVEIEGKAYTCNDSQRVRVVAMRDISEKKQKQLESIKARENAEKSEQKYRNLVNNSPVGIIGTKDGKIIFGNPTLVDLLEFNSIEELINHQTIPLWKNKSKREKLLAEIKENGRVDNFEIEGVTKKGNIFHVLFSATMDNNIITGMLMDITKEKRAAKKLKESEEDYRSLYENATVAMVRTDLKTGKIIKANNAIAKIFGFSTAEEYVRDFKAIDHYVNPKDREAIVRQLNKDGNVEKIVVNTKKKDGTLMWTEVSFKLNNEKGFIEAVAIDITDRIKEQEKNFKLATAIDQSPASVVITDNNGIIEYVNPCFTELTGYSIEELIGQNPRLLKSDQHNKDFYKNIWETITSGKIWKGEIRNKKKKGELYWEEAKIAPVIERGEITHYIAIKEDITEQKHSIKQLEIHNTRLESLSRILHNHFANSNEMLDYTLEQALKLTESKIGYIYYYNEEIQQLTLHSWSGDAMKECKVTNRQTVYDLNETGCWGEAVRQRKPYVINDFSKPNKEIKGTPEGHVSLKKFLSIPVIIDNEVKAVIGVANKENDYIETDIKQLTLIMNTVWKNVEQKQYEQDLIASKEKAEESDRLKTAFLTNMSHEIRTPMNGILGFANLLKEPGLSGKQQQQFISIIEESGARMLNTIHDIIDISRIELGQMQVSISEINLNMELDDQFVFFLQEAKKKNVQLSFTNRVPEHQATFKSDKEKINSAVTNLIKNAIKYTHSGSIEFGYNINEKERQSELEFFIRDTGIGIPKERQKAIFDRFVQADIEDKQAYQGSGLGLAISKAYLEMLGGKIWVESEEGIGSQFYFTVPYDRNDKEI